MPVIAYDQPVKDLIEALARTEHVTRIPYRKTHVTLHHNGGRLSHEGVLAVWQERPASAHFDVDAYGDIAQYVNLNEYAWATGNTDGNERSISIEMCNETLAPEWRVSERTWQSAARLAGWIFARAIGQRPNANTLVRHKYWSATDCAGPHIDREYSKILQAAQYHYDVFTGAIEEEKPMDWATFKAFQTRWWIYHSRQRGSEYTDGPTAPEMLASIQAKNLVMDVDEEALAAALIARGFDPSAVSLAKMKSAFAEVLSNTQLVPPAI